MTKFLEALLLMLACTAGVVACGGSASETPPPLEPTSNPRASYAQPSRPASQTAPKPKGAGASDDTESADDASEAGESDNAAEEPAEAPASLP